MPHTLRSLRLADELLVEMTVLCDFDDDQSRSTIVTLAMPPPSHIVWRP
jgi:hypothetical protein